MVLGDCAKIVQYANLMSNNKASNLINSSKILTFTTDYKSRVDLLLLCYSVKSHITKVTAYPHCNFE